MDGIDANSELEGGDEGSSGEVEGYDEPVEAVLDEGLSSSNSTELAIDIDLEQVITDPAACSKYSSGHQAHRQPLIDHFTSKNASSQGYCRGSSQRISSTGRDDGTCIIDRIRSISRGTGCASARSVAEVAVWNACCTLT